MVGLIRLEFESWDDKITVVSDMLARMPPASKPAAKTAATTVLRRRAAESAGERRGDIGCDDLFRRFVGSWFFSR